MRVLQDSAGIHTDQVHAVGGMLIVPVASLHGKAARRHCVFFHNAPIRVNEARVRTGFRSKPLPDCIAGPVKAPPGPVWLALICPRVGRFPRGRTWATTPAGSPLPHVGAKHTHLDVPDMSIDVDCPLESSKMLHPKGSLSHRF